MKTLKFHSPAPTDPCFMNAESSMIMEVSNLEYSSCIFSLTATEGEECLSQ